MKAINSCCCLVIPAQFLALIQTKQNKISDTDPKQSTALLTAQKRSSSTNTSPDASASNALITVETKPSPSDSDTKVPSVPSNPTNQKHKIRNTNPETCSKPLVLTATEIEIITTTVNHIQQTKYTDTDFSAEQFIKVLRTSRGNPNKAQLAKTLTQNTDCSLFTLEEIKPQIKTGTNKTFVAVYKAVLKSLSLSDLSDFSI